MFLEDTAQGCGQEWGLPGRIFSWLSLPAVCGRSWLVHTFHYSLCFHGQGVLAVCVCPSLCISISFVYGHQSWAVTDLPYFSGWLYLKSVIFSDSSPMKVILWVAGVRNFKYDFAGGWGHCSTVWHHILLPFQELVCIIKLGQLLFLCCWVACGHFVKMIRAHGQSSIKLCCEKSIGILLSMKSKVNDTLSQV